MERGGQNYKNHYSLPVSMSKLCCLMSSTGLRCHEFKLYKPETHLDIRKNFLPSELLVSGIDCLWYVVNI